MPAVFFPDIVGNSALVSRLRSDICENMLSHAYILEGPLGGGRHTFALHTVAALCCEELSFAKIAPGSGRVPCGKCKSCEKILNGKSPDVTVIGLEGEKVTIGVEQIRQLKNDMYTAPNDLAVKAYIIENADCMTVQAQNAFLLSLEEPPAYILFFLICENSANLLETVRSRAPTLRTERISEEKLGGVLLEKDKRARQMREESPNDWQTLLRVSAGSIGYATELLDTRHRKQVFEYRRVAKDIVSMLSSSDASSALEAISSFGSKRKDVSAQLTFLQYALRDLVLLKKCENAPLCFFEDRESAAELATHFTAQGLLTLYDASVRAMDDLECNSNVRLTLMSMMQYAGLI